MVRQAARMILAQAPAHARARAGAAARTCAWRDAHATTSLPLVAPRPHCLVVLLDELLVLGDHLLAFDVHHGVAQARGDLAPLGRLLRDLLREVGGVVAGAGWLRLGGGLVAAVLLRLAGLLALVVGLGVLLAGLGRRLALALSLVGVVARLGLLL